MSQSEEEEGVEDEDEELAALVLPDVDEDPADDPDVEVDEDSPEDFEESETEPDDAVTVGDEVERLSLR